MLFHPTKTVLVLKDFFQKTENAYFLFIFILLNIRNNISIYYFNIIYKVQKPRFSHEIHFVFLLYPLTC